MNPPMPIEDVIYSLNTARRRYIKHGLTARTAQILKAAAREQFDEQINMEHSIPGPSSVLKCRRQLWFSVNGWPKSDEGELGNDLSIARGIVMESYWRAIFAEADPKLEITPAKEPVTVAPGVIGSPDGYLNELNALVEFKSLTGWRYHYLSRDGVFAQQPDYVAQANLYMHGTNRDWCLFVAAPGDPQLYKWVVNKRKDPAKKTPTLYATWIQYDPKAAKMHLERAANIKIANADERVADADYNPEIDNFPCGYCDWKQHCLEVNQERRNG